MLVAILKFVGSSEKGPTMVLMKLSLNYNFNFRFYNISRRNEKDHIEWSVEYVRSKEFCKRSNFTFLEAANSVLQKTCIRLNTYYNHAIQGLLNLQADIFNKAEFAPGDITRPTGRKLSITVANVILKFEKEIRFQTTLSEVKWNTSEHRARAISAAKNPQLKMKLENMLIPLTAA